MGEEILVKGWGWTSKRRPPMWKKPRGCAGIESSNVASLWMVRSSRRRRPGKGGDGVQDLGYRGCRATICQPIPKHAIEWWSNCKTYFTAKILFDNRKGNKIISLTDRDLCSGHTVYRFLVHQFHFSCNDEDTTWKLCNRSCNTSLHEFFVWQLCPSCKDFLKINTKGFSKISVWKILFNVSLSVLNGNWLP